MNPKDTLKHFYEKKYGTQKWENSSCYATHGDWLIEAMESTSNPSVHNVPEEGLKKFIDFLIESHVIKADTKEDMYCYATEFLEASPPPMGNVPTDSDIEKEAQNQAYHHLGLNEKTMCVFPIPENAPRNKSFYEGFNSCGKWMTDEITCATSLPTEAEEIVLALSNWSEKYPRSGTYHVMAQPKMDSELIEIEKRAKELSLSNDNSQREEEVTRLRPGTIRNAI